MTSWEWYLHLDKPITHSPETWSSVIQYLMDCGAPIDNTYDDNFDRVGTIEADWVPTSKDFKDCYNQLITLMASYNIRIMYDALGAEIPSIAVAAGLHFGKKWAQGVCRHCNAQDDYDKVEGDSKVVRNDLMTKLKQCVGFPRAHLRTLILDETPRPCSSSKEPCERAL